MCNDVYMTGLVASRSLALAADFAPHRNYLIVCFHSLRLREAYTERILIVTTIWYRKQTPRQGFPP